MTRSVEPVRAGERRGPSEEPVQLEPLQRLPLKEQVIRQLRGLIETGSLRSGQQLPSERELSEQLRVSRGTVREAVQFLHALGLVETHHGTGTFVSDATHDQQKRRSEWRQWTRRHSGRIHELIEVRRALESTAAELAATRRVPEGLAGMVEAIEQMAAAAESEDVTSLVQADVLFHRALCDAAGNTVLAELADTVGERLLRERAALWDLPDRPERSLHEHSQVYEAISAGDVARARSTLLEHFASVERDIETLSRDRREVT